MARRLTLRSVLAVAIVAIWPAYAGAHPADAKLDAALRARAHAPHGNSRVIIRTVNGAAVDEVIRVVSGKPRRAIGGFGWLAAVVPDSSLEQLAADPAVEAIGLDRPVRGTIERTSAAIGARWVRDELGLDGTGIGVAIIDSGVTSWHDDLGAERVVHFRDFVGQQPSAYDDYGHGTHVAGIIAGNGYDSDGGRTGIAPGASLVVLKVLDAGGDGYISNVIAALDYAVERRSQFNIRVINLSVAAGVHESYTTDPLTLAARRAVEAGITVVTAAGNFGLNAQGQAQYGGITAPGNAPWVLTVGAASHNGTVSRTDDIVAPFSSRGPTYIDKVAKPDIVAPGVGIESLADSSSSLYSAHPAARLWGTVDTVTPPYLSLSGTSMAAPVVAGTIALMLQANPALTPNLVKAALQYTAEFRSKYDYLTEGAGFLNARGAVQFAQSLIPGRDTTISDPTPWSRRIIWGNRPIGGTINPAAGAWRTDVMWGAAATRDGNNIVWSVPTRDEDDVVWGTVCAAIDCAGTVWGTVQNDAGIVWGSLVAPAPDVIWRRGTRR
jgi:serine protease AprX